MKARALHVYGILILVVLIVIAWQLHETKEENAVNARMPRMRLPR